MGEGGHVICGYQIINYQVKVKLPFRRVRFTELTDSQWKAIKDFVDNGRKRKNCLRTILNAIPELNCTGCQWRKMDEKYPPWQSAYHYFRKWKKDGTWSVILLHLVENERVRQGQPWVGFSTLELDF